MTLSHQNTTYTLDTVAVHMALLKSGKIIAFTGDDDDIGNWNKGKSSLWNPNDPDKKDNPVLSRNLFCAGHCILPDGRVFAAGGQSTVHPPFPNGFASFLGILQLFVRGADHDIHTFDPQTLTWTRHQNMPKARWYPTCVTLPDGRALIVSGIWSQAHGYLFKNHFINLNYEIFDPQINSLSKPKPFLKKIKAYPFLQVLPGGTLFVHFENKTRLLKIPDFEDTSKEFTTIHDGTRTYPGMGCCTLLPLMPSDTKFKILIAGGSKDLSPNNTSETTDIAEIFTFDSINPNNSKWEKTNPTNMKRFLSDSVILPDGKILLINGASGGTSDDNHCSVREIELFDPKTSDWSMHGILQRDRLYHSSALLLADGKVVVAGSTGHKWTDPKYEKEIEIISPPYFDGNPHRPEITDPPQEVTYDTSFEINSPDSAEIAKIVLIRCSSTTHNNNMDQRCVVLSITDVSNNSLKVQSPKDSTYAPPGYYLLFILNNENVPSKGEFVKVG